MLELYLPSPPIETIVGDVELRVLRYQVRLVRRRPPALDLATVNFEKLGTLWGIMAVSVDSIAACKAFPWAGWVRTHVPVAIFEMAVPVALDLLERRVPVSAFLHPTKMGYFVAEVCNGPSVTVVAVVAPILIRSVVVVGVVVLVNGRLSDGMKAYRRKNRPPGFLRHRPACSFSSPRRILDRLYLSSVLGNAMKIHTPERELTHRVRGVNATRRLGQFSTNV